MGKKIIIVISIIAVIFIGGVLLSLYIIKETPKYKIIGDTPTHINPDTCPQKAKFVIDQHSLSLIHSCDVEEVKYGSQKAYLVEIFYGPGMDCPSGCIYNSDFNIVFENDSIYQIKDFYFANPERNVIEYIWNEIKLPVSNLDKISTKELVNYNDKLAFKFTFSRYISGEVYVLENQPIQGEIIPTDMTVDQAREIALNELSKKGYEPNYKFKDPISDNKFIDKDCWNFFVITEPKKHTEYDKCSVMVCLDGSTSVNCKP